MMNAVFLSAFLAAVVVGTWNGRWFPAGDADHRPAAEVEARTIADAGRLLACGLSSVDPFGTNDVILCLNEMRDPRAVRALAAAIGRTNLVLAAMSAYRRKDRFDKQQDAILTTLPVAARNWSYWKHEKGIRPPRGYVRADLVLVPAVTASVYAVHLKANGVTDNPAENRRKRSIAARQLVAMAKSAPAAVIAGDMNADDARAEFKSDTLFADFAKVGFADVLALLPPAARVTHPSARYGDSALDRIFLRGLRPDAPPRILPAGTLSDHRPVFVLLSP